MPEGVRFNRTVIIPLVGELTDLAVDALVIPANTRGIMGAGMIGAVRSIGGVEIEREAMSQAPLTLGSAISTTAGKLSEHGVQAVIHAVITESLGSPAHIEVVRRTIIAALRIVEERRFRTIAIPLLVGGAGTGQVAPDIAAGILVEEVVAHLRRTASTRLERVYLVSRSEADVVLLDEAIRLAREHIWGQPA